MPTDEGAILALGPKDLEEQDARIQKLHAELRVIEQQLSPRAQRYELLRVVGAISGMFAALVATVGLIASSYQWRLSATANRTLQVDQRLDSALRLLSSNTASGRLAAIVSLNTFIDDPDGRYAHLATVGLTNELATEESPTLRNAIVGTIRDIRTPTKKQGDTERYPSVASRREPRPGTGRPTGRNTC